MTLFQLVYGRIAITTLGSMLLIHEDKNDIDVNNSAQTPVATTSTGKLCSTNPEEWVWTPVHQCNCSEKLLRKYFVPY